MLHSSLRPLPSRPTQPAAAARDAPADGNMLLVTGAVGAVGGYVASLAPDRGWRVTGLARAEDEDFIRAASGELPARVHAIMPLDQVATVHRAMAKGGLRGRYVLEP